MVLAGKLNKEVVGTLVPVGVRAVGLSGVDGGLLIGAASRRRPTSASWVRSSTSTSTCFGRWPTGGSCRWWPRSRVDETGQAYNVNADVVASELAVALGAEKLVFINDVPGLIGPAGDLLSELSSRQCLDLLAQTGVVEGGMIPKLESAVRALEAGVGRVHLVDGRVEHSLVLELFTPEGVGTMITRDADGLVEVSRVTLPGESSRDAHVRPLPAHARARRGVRVWDDAGGAYLDFAGAIGVTAIGHSPSRVGAGGARPGRPARHGEQPVRDRAPGMARAAPRGAAAGARRPRVLLQLGRRGERSRHQAGAPVGAAAGEDRLPRAWTGRSTGARSAPWPPPASRLSAPRSSRSWTGSGSSPPTTSRRSTRALTPTWPRCTWSR